MSDNGCLRVGQPAPDFTATAVVDQEFKEISLSKYRGKYVVLFFYPLDFTFVCPTEIHKYIKLPDKQYGNSGRTDFIIKQYFCQEQRFAA